MATKYLVIQGTANSSEEAITLCGEALHKAGIVGEDFGKACVEREKDYPTGLPTVRKKATRLRSAVVRLPSFR